MSIDNENSLFKQITKGEIPNSIEQSQFNKRRKKCLYFNKWWSNARIFSKRWKTSWNFGFEIIYLG